jgi:RNA polymerase sigma-70 factor (ECF subfamily)
MAMVRVPELVDDAVRSEALRRARRGDARAFETLVRHYDPELRALAFRLLGDRDRMDDALQEAYVKAFRALPAFRGASSFGTWLYRIAYNACLDELERSRRVVRLPFDEREHGEAGPALESDVSMRHEIAHALSTLPPADRAAVLLVDVHGFSYDETAAVLDVPAGTVGSRLNRARATLRRALGGPTRGAIER